MPPLKDLKEGLSSNRKPDLTHIRYAFATYCARPCEYGCDKYERANYLRSLGEPHTTPTGADFERFRKYLRAMISHGLLVLDSMERHQANDPKLEDVEGMTRAAFAVDTDEDVTGKVGPSRLPHVAMCGSSLMMAIEQAVDCGLLPRDPGAPWKAAEAEAKLLSRTQAAVQHPLAYLYYCDRCGIRMLSDEPLRVQGKPLWCVQCTHQVPGGCTDEGCGCRTPLGGGPSGVDQ